MSTDGEYTSRPCSLVLEPPPPEREPLHFDVQLIGAPPEVEQLVNNIKQVAEDFLYHWKTYPIVLPPSRFTGPGNRLSDIIIPPPCDELDAAVLDASPEPEPLSPKQLQSIRERGEFEVISRHFPGQTHVWRVAGWLQRGRARAREDFLRGVARALALVVVVARDRLHSDKPLSLRAGLAALAHGLHRLLDLLIGMPSMEARDLEKKIREERSRYLVAELICKPEQEEDIATVAAWVTRAMRRVGGCGSEQLEGRESARAQARVCARVPLHYSTPQRTRVDLRLYRRELLRRAAPALQALLEREARGWFLHFRERTAARLLAAKAPPDALHHEVRAAAMREYVARLCAALPHCAPLLALGAGVPALLADQLRAAALLAAAEESVHCREQAALAAAEARLRAKHPLLARSGAWRAERLAGVARRLRADSQWAAREEAAAAMRAADLHQHRYFLMRDLAFLRDREPLLAAELRAATVPTRTFAWSARPWGGARWRGGSPVPTAAGGAGASPAPSFLVRSERVHTASTRWPGWRVAVAAQRTRSWSCKLAYVLVVLVAWNSPLSLRTLLRRDPILPDIEMSQVNGTLYPTRGGGGGGEGGGETHTMWSRLLALWRHVSKERSRIDAEPDTGLLGAGCGRWARRAALWAGGALASALLLVVFPLCVVLACLLAALAALAIPLWVPPLVLLYHLQNMLFYDFDCPRPNELNRWFPLVKTVVCYVCVLGVLQPAVAVVVALVVCPVGALALVVGGTAWAGVRAVWEAVAWRALIVRGARVPHHDSAFCRRVAGPGLAHPPLYGLTAAQAAAAAAARAELDALAAWAQRTEADIERPLKDYRHFVDACFGPFSVQIAKTGSYRALERECAALVGELRGAVSARRRELALPLGAGVRARCRLPAGTLRQARTAAAAEARRAWRAVGAGAGAGEWWAARGLDVDDWHAVAAHALLDAFHGDVLLPLEEGAACLPLDTGGSVGARAWEARCARAQPPDLVGGGGAGGDAGEAWPAVGTPRVAPPTLDLSAFNPRAPRHPPLPQPAVVAIVLHNREAEAPVPLESELCADILRALEDSPDPDDAPESVSRYRGGGSSASSSDGDADADGDADLGARPDADLEEGHAIRRRLESGAESGVGVGVGVGVGACRWTLTGRGVRLRADLASPEDVTLALDSERRGTSV